MARESPLTAPTPSRPIARRDFRGILIHDGSGIVTPATHNINAQFIRTPATVNWTYVVVGGKALYNGNANDAQNFELHPSEETELVLKILTLAGFTLKDAALYQAAAGEDMKNTQQEKQ